MRCPGKMGLPTPQGLRHAMDQAPLQLMSHFILITSPLIALLTRQGDRNSERSSSLEVTQKTAAGSGSSAGLSTKLEPESMSVRLSEAQRGRKALFKNLISVLKATSSSASTSPEISPPQVEPALLSEAGCGSRCKHLGAARGC